MKPLIIGFLFGVLVTLVLFSAALTWVVNYRMLDSLRSWAAAAFENGEATTT